MRVPMSRIGAKKQSPSKGAGEVCYVSNRQRHVRTFTSSILQHPARIFAWLSANFGSVTLRPLDTDRNAQPTLTPSDCSCSLLKE